jgi:hypothetical protein
MRPSNNEMHLTRSAPGGEPRPSQVISVLGRQSEVREAPLMNGTERDALHGH